MLAQYLKHLDGLRVVVHGNKKVGKHFVGFKSLWLYVLRQVGIDDGVLVPQQALPGASSLQQ